MSFAGYPKYKSSGIEWLCQLPEHWHSGSVRWLARRYAGGTPDKTNLSFWENGTVPWINSGAVNDRLISEPSAYITTEALEKSSAKWIPAKALVMALAGQGKTKGMVAQLGIPTACNQSMVAIIPGAELNARFLFWWLDSNYENIRNLAGGDLRDGLNLELVGSIKCPLPSSQEQIAIAAFLDQETAKIDTLVTEQKRLMALLKEKRQAVISHAVTKGLNPKASMKPSGIEWLGDAPAHWQIKPLRYLGRCQNGLNIDGDAFGSGFPFVSYGDVYRNRVLPPLPSGLVESSKLDWERYSVERGDIFFTRTSETIEEIGIASVCLSTIPRATFAGFLIRFRPDGALDCSFSKHYFSNPQIGTFFASEMNLVTRASLSQDLLKGLPVLLPPKSEQLEIAVFLDECVDSFEQLTSEAQRSIDLLQERRTALISAAVTGQIDTRNQ